ncbi:hypothetical protein C7999DRAFT_31274 [Corynascus novoguineensis]|uniref:DUF1772-domain-containing protein n=1 Tax=Corynascus novoguineensis TaxID=1126955 RepID=A0AAN7HFX5_9PEZI|nr:hypothetical protein C7999DRAFT_31274 [Corynascus novoguineensis]
MATKRATTQEPKIGVPATAVVSGAFLSGSMMSLSAFVIPVFLGTNSNDAGHTTRQWALLYQYGRQYMPVLCIATCGLYGSAILSKHKASRRYAMAIAATMAMVPFTWLVMAPTNETLFGLEEATGSGSMVEPGLVSGLAVRWAWLHVARSLFPLVGAIVGFTGLLQELAV